MNSKRSMWKVLLGVVGMGLLVTNCTIKTTDDDDVALYCRDQEEGLYLLRRQLGQLSVVQRRRRHLGRLLLHRGQRGRRELERRFVQQRGYEQQQCG